MDETGVQRNLFVQMEEERRNLPHALKEDFIPKFVVNLLRKKLYPADCDETTMRRSKLFNLKRKEHGSDASTSQNDWTDNSLLEEFTEFEDSFVLNDETLAFVRRVLKFITEAMEIFQVDSKQFVKLFFDELENPNLELLYMLDTEYHLLSLNTYLMMLKYESQKQHFERQFISFCCSNLHCDAMYKERSVCVLHYFFNTFLVAAYCNPGKSTALESLKNLSTTILFNLSSKLVEKDGPCISNRQLLLTSLQEVAVPSSVRRKYFTDQLNNLLTIRKEYCSSKSYTLEELIQYQEALAKDNENSDYSNVAEVLRVMTSAPNEATDIIRTISNSVRNSTRNWTFILLLIGEWLRKMQFEAASLLKELIRIFMRDGLSSRNEEQVSIAFILARHCSLVTPPKVFPRYEIWYSDMFSEDYTPAKDTDTFHFLANLLQGWVSFEPSCFLQVQATFWPYIPRTQECRGMWKTYVELAKSRVAEYNEVEEAMALEPNLNNPVLHDVEVAIKDYENTRAIPLSVGQMYLFNKKYYTEQFLPVLLKKPSGTIFSDARFRLIEALNQNGKIPRDLYMAYKQTKGTS